MEFEMLFKDGSKQWLAYDFKDLYPTVQYEDYCRSKPELQLLLYPAKEADKILTKWKQEPITLVKPGDKHYVDLRSYGDAWYNTLPLPDIDHKTYVLLYEYKKPFKKGKTYYIQAHEPVLNDTFNVSNDFIKRYGSNNNLVPNGTDIILIDEEFVLKYPFIKQIEQSFEDNI
jgi:hypothetical protein